MQVPLNADFDLDDYLGHLKELIVGVERQKYLVADRLRNSVVRAIIYPKPGIYGRREKPGWARETEIIDMIRELRGNVVTAEIVQHALQRLYDDGWLLRSEGVLFGVRYVEWALRGMHECLPSQLIFVEKKFDGVSTQCSECGDFWIRTDLGNRRVIPPPSHVSMQEWEEEAEDEWHHRRRCS